MWGVHRALEGSEESHKRSSLLKKSLSKRSMGRRRTQTLPKQVQTTYKWTSRSLNKAQKRTRARCLDKPPCKGRTISGTDVSCSPGPSQGLRLPFWVPALSSSFTFFSLRGRNSRRFIYC